MSYHIDQQFSTLDQDNDGVVGDCSGSFGNGGNWFYSCFSNGQNLNAMFGNFGNGYMQWVPFDENLIKTSRMMFRSTNL